MRAVVIDWKSAEYLSVLTGQTCWGNRARRREAIADLGNAMSSNNMGTSFECWGEIEEDPVRRAVNAERNAIVKFLALQSNTGKLIEDIKAGKHYDKK